MDPRRIALSGTTSEVLGSPMEGHEGYWIVQVTITGTYTVTPEGSLDGATWVARKLSPIDGGADVANTAASGLFTVKGSCPLRLSGAGTGSAVILATPVVS